MAIKTIRVFAEYTSDGYVPMPSQGNIDYGVTVGSTFPETQPSSFQTDDPNIDVAVTTMTDFYVWIRTHGSAWNPSYTRVVRVYPDSPSINSVVMNMIVAVGGGGTTISSGGGVSYYLNGGTSQGILDGSTYYEMNKVPVEGTGVDFFKINTTGFQNIAQFVTDAGDPGLLNIPAGNWPLGFYMSASDNSGAPKFYAEIYKYSAAGVFTLLGSSVATPEVISNGQAIDFYTSNVAIPDTTLLVTDRIAIRIFVDTDGNRTINLHTQDSHLSTVGTTFTRGLTAINGLIKQVQFLAIGNAGSDAAIVSSDDTHTINLPTASATKRGLLNSTDWSTFNAKQPALSGDGFVKISGSTISYDNSYYQPLDGDLTAIGALAGTSGILKKTGANTWELDTTTYLSTGVAASTYQRLDKMVSNLLASDTEYPNSNAVLAALALKANATNPTFSGYLTISGASPKIYLTDTDNNPDYFIGNDDGYFRIYDQTNSLSRFYITNVGVSTFPGDVIVGSIAKSGGTASQFLKADGTVDSTTYATSASLADYLTSATAATTYQRLDKMVSNLLASDTEYPNSNAVLAKLALKADAANPSFTGSMNISGAESRVNFYDETAARKYFIGYDGGFLRIYQDAGSASRFYINTTGKTFIPGTLEVGTIIKTSGLATEFLKADGTVDSNSYALANHTHTYYVGKTAVQSSSANQALTGISGITFVAEATDSASIGTTISGTSTFFDFNLTDDNNNDEWRWRFTPSGATAYNAMRLVPDTNTSSNLIVSGSITGSSFVKSGGTASQFLKADGSVDSSTYISSTTAASTYQRLDKMVSNLLASSTEYPNSNAVIAALALKANAANPTFTGDFTISGATPRLYFVDTDNNPDYTLFTDSGYFYIYDQTAGATRFSINSSGNINSGVGKSITAGSFIKESGTSSQYLMADGSVSTLTNPTTGTGTGNYLSKWTSGSELGNSQIYDNGTNLSIGTLVGITEQKLQLLGQGTNYGLTISSSLDNTTISTNGGKNIIYLLNTFSGAHTSIGLSSNDSDGQHHRVVIGAKKDPAGSTAGQLDFIMREVGGTYAIKATLLSNGNYGLGTTSPSSKLTLARASETTASQIELRNIGGISDGNYDGIKFTQSSSGTTPLGSIRLKYKSNGYPDFGIFTRSGDTTENERFTILNNGNIGINNTSPTYKLDILGTTDQTLRLKSTSANGVIYFEGAARQWGIFGGATSTEGRLTFKDETANVEAMAFASGGNVLIGTTTNSGYRFDVNGQGRFSSKLTVNNIAWINRPTNKIDNNGAIEFGGKVEFNNAFVSGQSGYVVAYYPTYNNFLITADYDGNLGGVQPNIQIGRGTNPAIHIQNSGSSLGNVGINNTSPSYKLDIVGNARLTTGGTGATYLYFHDFTDYKYLAYYGSDTYWRTSGDHVFEASSGFKGTFKANGNLLIGTLTDSGQKLQVNGDVNTSTRYLVNTGTANQSMAIGFWDSANARIEGGSAYPLFITSYNGVIKFGPNGGETLRITAAGELLQSQTNGIITQQGGTGYSLIRMYGNSNGVEMQIGAHQVSGVASIGTYSASDVIVKTSNTERLRIYYNGILESRKYMNFGLDYSSSQYVTISENQVFRTGGGTLYINNSGSGHIAMAEGGGNVLINTSTSAGYKLDVNGQTRIKSTAQSVLYLSQNIVNSDFNDVFFIENTNSGQRAQIGMSTNDTDGQHHRVSLRAYKGSGTYTGTFGIVLRNVNAQHIERLTLTSVGDLSVAGTMTSTGFFESSDSRLKELLKDDVQVKDIENLKAKLYIKNGREEYGYFAQEAETYMPSAVTKNSEGYLNLSYREVHTVKIARLEREVEALKKQLNVA